MIAENTAATNINPVLQDIGAAEAFIGATTKNVLKKWLVAIIFISKDNTDIDLLCE